MRILRLYLKAYSGISPPVWMLSIVLLINRSGSMVLPFLSLYLTDELHLDLKQVGFILASFGAGSLVGSLLGGYLTDRLGSFSVQLFSLVFGGLGFFLLFELQSFEALLGGFFGITVVTDMLRPANATAIAGYAVKENMTRAYSLNRMAVNLGYAIGPAVGGFLALKGYQWLFYVDGATCILAGALFAWYFWQRQPRNQAARATDVAGRAKSPFRDASFLVFGLLTISFAVVFFQLFNTLPLYYREVYEMPENHIGWLLALNGLIVFGVEMPLVYLLGNRYSVRSIVAVGTSLTGLSFAVLNLSEGWAILVISMAMLSVAEILVMPYLTVYTVNRAGDQSRGKYLGFYAMTYSAAFILAPLMGTYMIGKHSFVSLWLLTGMIGLLGALGFMYNMREVKAAPEIVASLSEDPSHAG